MSIYDNPDNYGLSIIGEIGNGYGYEWNVFVAYLQHETGKVYWYYGGGCSCYGPTDGMAVEDLRSGSFEDFRDSLESWLPTLYTPGYVGDEVRKSIQDNYRADAVQLLSKVSPLLL